MGKEIAGSVTTKLAEYMALDVGVAHALIGDFYSADADGVTELFSRLQFTW
jgi:hypothetical protein